MLKFNKLALIAPLVLASASSFAAIDITTATAGVSDAQTAVVSVLGVMITMVAAVFGYRKLKALFGG